MSESPPNTGPPRQNPVAARRASRSRLVLWMLVALAAIVCALWLLWGFRWEPTAEVVSDAGLRLDQTSGSEWTS